MNFEKKLLIKIQFDVFVNGKNVFLLFMMDIHFFASSIILIKFLFNYLKLDLKMRQLHYSIFKGFSSMIVENF